MKLLDFGLARQVESEAEVTGSGAMIGTPAYMAPEQLEGAEVDARSDIYAVGLVMYELFSGRRAFAGATTADVLQQVLAAHVMPIERLVPDIDPDLARVIGRAMARQPGDRYGDLQAMRKDLARARRRVMQASGDDATVVVGVMGAGGGTLATPPPAADQATVVPPPTKASSWSSDTIYAPAAAPVPATGHVTAPAIAPPPPLPGAPRGPAAGWTTPPDDGPLPVPLPSVPYHGALAPANAGRSTVDASVLGAARDLAVPATVAVGPNARVPASAAPPPVASRGVIHSTGVLESPVPTARRGVSAALVVGGLLAMLTVSFMVAFMAARSFGLLGGAPPAEASRPVPTKPTLPAEASVPRTPEPAAPPATTTRPGEEPGAAVADAAEVMAPSTPVTPVQGPVAVPPAATPGRQSRTPRSTPGATPPVVPSRPLPAAVAPPPAPAAASETPVRPLVVADAPPRPVERREPDPPPAVAPQAEGIALVRAYVAARNTAHASGIRRVWPGVDDNHLRRVTTSFSAPLSLADCQVESSDGARATATCRLTQPGTTDGYAPGQGLTIRRTFVFELAREGRGWVIAGLRE